MFAAIDPGPDGRAALDLGARIAHNNRSRLRALLISHDELAISATQPDACATADGRVAVRNAVKI